jgi:hypothetical protein
LGRKSGGVVGHFARGSSVTGFTFSPLRFSGRLLISLPIKNFRKSLILVLTSFKGSGIVAPTVRDTTPTGRNDMKNYFVEIELDGTVCAKSFKSASRPTEEDARRYFRDLGYKVGLHVRFC